MSEIFMYNDLYEGFTNDEQRSFVINQLNNMYGSQFIYQDDSKENPKDLLILCADNKTIIEEKSLGILKSINLLPEFYNIYYIGLSISEKIYNVINQKGQKNHYSNVYIGELSILQTNPELINKKFDIIINEFCPRDILEESDFIFYIEKILKFNGFYITSSRTKNNDYYVELSKFYKYVFGSVSHFNTIDTFFLCKKINMSWVLDINPKTLEIKGFLNFCKSKFNKKIYEIYNSNGVLKKILSKIDNDKYYLVQVDIDDIKTQKIFFNSFFCDFIGIGSLSKSDKISFIMGGTPTIDCSKQKDILSETKKILEKINTLENSSISLSQVYNYIKNNFPVFNFYNSNYETIEKIKDLHFSPENPYIQIRFSNELIQLMDDPKIGILFTEYREIINSILIYMNKILSF